MRPAPTLEAKTEALLDGAKLEPPTYIYEKRSIRNGALATTQPLILSLQFFVRNAGRNIFSFVKSG